MTSERNAKETKTTVDQQTKAALKHDQFVETTAHGISWASEHRRSLIADDENDDERRAGDAGDEGAALVIILIIGGFVLYNYRCDKASTAFGAAMQAYQTPLAEPGQTVPAGVKTFPSVVERAKAANAQFLAIANQYGMTPSGKLSLYFAGLTYIEANQNASAEDTLKKVSSGWDKDLSALAKLSLAQLYRQTSRDQQAIDLYNQLTAKPTTTVPAGLAQLQLAELYESEGKPDEAKKIYAQLKDKDAKGTIGGLAAQKLNPAPAPGAGPAIQAQ